MTQRQPTIDDFEGGIPPSATSPSNDTTINDGLDNIGISKNKKKISKVLATGTLTQGLPVLINPPICQPAIERGNRTIKNNYKNDNDDDDDNYSERQCRICLDDDRPDDMIAPCQCKGSSKWVHRQCLDQWRVHETDKAFSKCMECLFDYHLQPVVVIAQQQQQQEDRMAKRERRRRQVRSYWLVSKDLCLVHAVVQLAIVGVALVASWMDTSQSLPRYINEDYPAVVYYFFGVLGVLMVLGIFGSLTLCQNGCSLSDSLQPFQVHRDAQTYEARSPHYHQLRQKQSRRYRQAYSTQDCCDNCCRIRYHSPSPYYYGDPGPSFSCCSCCCDNRDYSMTRGIGGGSSSSSSSSGPICCCDNCDCGLGSGSGSGSDGARTLLLCLFIGAAVAMVVVGLLTGMVLMVLMIQRTVQRHIYLLHKTQLTQEFQVVDLAKYDHKGTSRPIRSSLVVVEDVEQPPVSPASSPSQSTRTTNTKAAEDEEEIVVHPMLSAPTLQESDAIYLKSLGLMES